MFKQILYGGDYNPEQWPKEVWPEDARLMGLANWNVATLPVFGWANLEPEEGVFTFEWLDEVIEHLTQGGVGLCLATATASVPAWVSQKYPDILVTNRSDQKQRHGNRHTFCPNSPNYRRLSTTLARKIAERYGSHPGLRLWHINNEYGTYCYCDQCAAAFRVWLQAKYGSLDALNEAWSLFFWGHNFSDWSQVEPPTDNGEGSVQALKIDWYRFQSQSILNCFVAERDVLREITPNVPITTNLMGNFYPLDYFQWAKEMDVASWDNYPYPGARPSHIAFWHDVIRGLKQGQPFLLMEQSPSQQNWQPYNTVKQPGQLRLQSFQTVAHGADAIMYFQWRRGRGGQEKFHGAVMEHGGTSENRVFQDVAKLGRELKDLGESTLGGRTPAKVALMFDWDSWWGLSVSSGPSVDLKYLETVRDFYTALYELGVPVDVIHPSHDLSRYDLIVSPLMYMMAPGVAERIEERVGAGASFLTTTYSGIVDPNDRVFLEGGPGPLHEVLGLHVEETDAVLPGEPNGMRTDLGEFDTLLLCDRIQLRGAEALGTYTRNFYAGEPCFTVNRFGAGKGYYLASLPDAAGLLAVLGQLCEEVGATCPLGAAPPKGVEVTVRTSPKGKDLLYLLHHGAEPTKVGLPSGEFRDLLSGQTASGAVSMAPRQAMILEPA